MPTQTRTARKKLTAKTADKHVLYQLSVQGPEEDSRFLGRLFRRLTGRPMRVFREDFCGTAILSCHHIKNHRDNVAIGVDIHGPTLDWARKHNLSQLKDAQRDRMTLLQEDVRHVQKPRADLIAALNFSYSCFQDRDTLRGYMENAYRGLAKDGVLILDAWGGGDTQVEEVDERDIEEEGYRFAYHWDQHHFDPVSHHTICKIHFEFEDGSRMNDAFVYDWRLWTLPEMQELMVEAGFGDVHVLWEGTDRDTNEGNGVFRRVKKGEADPSWVAYVVGRKGAN